MLSQCRHKAADVGLYTFSISLFRYEAIDFAGFLSGEVASLLVKYPTATVSAWAVFQPFTVQVNLNLNRISLVKFHH